MKTSKALKKLVSVKLDWGEELVAVVPTPMTMGPPMLRVIIRGRDKTLCEKLIDPPRKLGVDAETLVAMIPLVERLRYRLSGVLRRGSKK